MNFSILFIFLATLVIIYRIITAFKTHFELTKPVSGSSNEGFYTSSIPTILNLSNEELKKANDNLNLVILITQEILNNAIGTEKAAAHRILRLSNPTFKGKPLYVFQDDLKEADLTSELIDPYQYQALLQLKLKDHCDLRNMPKKGRVLGFTVGMTTIDGMPIAESHGFVDTYDIPPYDTWFYLYNDILLSWIPEEYLVHMQSAIDVEVFDSYFWLDEKYPKINEYLLPNINPTDQ